MTHFHAAKDALPHSYAGSTEVANFGELKIYHFHLCLLQTGHLRDSVFIRLLTETGNCGGRLPLVPHS